MIEKIFWKTDFSKNPSDQDDPNDDEVSLIVSVYKQTHLSAETDDPTAVKRLNSGPSGLQTKSGPRMEVVRFAQGINFSMKSY